ncbi:MAG TPA: hypothetical protein VHO07_04220 [Streptosporangiaceae bacterium]|nr:hypothetical protein [Streptosporangiaceae bacterium]
MIEDQREPRAADDPHLDACPDVADGLGVHHIRQEGGQPGERQPGRVGVDRPAPADGAGQVEAVHQLLSDQRRGHGRGIFPGEQRFDRVAVAASGDQGRVLRHGALQQLAQHRDPPLAESVKLPGIAERLPLADTAGRRQSGTFGGAISGAARVGRGLAQQGD